MIHPRTLSLYRSGAERALPAAQHDVARVGEWMTTGKRVNRASDDAAAYAKARTLDALASRHDAYERSAENGLDWLNHTQDALNTLADLFSEAQEAGLRAANDTLNTDDREIVARRLDNLIDATLDQLNRKSGDEYLFAGTATVLPPGTKPFEMTPLGALYNGNAADRTRQIGPDAHVPVNLSGALVGTTSGGTSILDALRGLANTLREDPLALPMDEALALVEEARDHVIDVGSEAGERASRITLALDHLRDVRLPLEAERSRAEDTDFLDAATQMQDAQTRLQAALKVTASIKQISLLDYLR